MTHWRLTWCRPCTALCWIDLSIGVCLFDVMESVQKSLRGLRFDWLQPLPAFT